MSKEYIVSCEVSFSVVCDVPANKQEEAERKGKAYIEARIEKLLKEHFNDYTGLDVGVEYAETDE